MTTTLFEKKLTDLLASGKRLKTGVANTKKGEKTFLLVDQSWFGGNGKCLTAFTTNGRPFKKDDYLVVWNKDGSVNAAVLNDSERANSSKYADLVFAD